MSYSLSILDLPLLKIDLSPPNSIQLSKCVKFS